METIKYFHCHLSAREPRVAVFQRTGAAMAAVLEPSASIEGLVRYQRREASGEALRQSYNAAFEELGLNWHFDAATFARLPSHDRSGLRHYIEREHAHLLRAYDAE